jgi:toxin ParE1/3/4
LKTYKVIMTDRSLADLDEISLYMERENPEAARPLGELLISSCMSLARVPYRFVEVGKSRKRGMLIHRMVVEPYLVFYQIEAEAVFVTRIRHGARRPLKRFD